MFKSFKQYQILNQIMKKKIKNIKELNFSPSCSILPIQLFTTFQHLFYLGYKNNMGIHARFFIQHVRLFITHPLTNSVAVPLVALLHHHAKLQKSALRNLYTVLVFNLNILHIYSTNGPFFMEQLQIRWKPVTVRFNQRDQISFSALNCPYYPLFMQSWKYY